MKRTSGKLACDRKEDLMTYLYDEAAPAERQSFEMHLTECPQCRDEIESFSMMRGQMQAWELGPAPHIQVNIKPTLWQAFKQFFQVAPMWTRFATAGAFGLILMALLNFQVTVGPNGVTFGVGRPTTQPQQVAVAPPPTVNPPAPVQVANFDEAATRKLVAELIAASETKQEERLKGQLQMVAAQLKAQNQAELVKFVNSLNREHRRQLLAVLNEADRRQSPDLLDLFGQVQSPDGGTGH